jgi:hypothetical protein
MDCFYHPAVAAVGICKSCGKGLCRACAVDLAHGLACRSRCENDVQALSSLIDRSLRNAPRNERLVSFNYRIRFAGAVFYILIGSLFLGYSIYQSVRIGGESPDVLFIGMGILFLTFGIYIGWRALKLPAAQNSSEPPDS